VDVRDLRLEQLLKHVAEHAVRVRPRSRARRRTGLGANPGVGVGRAGTRTGGAEAAAAGRVLEVARELLEEVLARALLLVLVGCRVRERRGRAGAEERVVLCAPGGVGEDVVGVRDGLLLSAQFVT
jgi:hypothetical protein